MSLHVMMCNCVEELVMVVEEEEEEVVVVVKTTDECHDCWCSVRSAHDCMRRKKHRWRVS